MDDVTRWLRGWSRVQSRSRQTPRQRFDATLSFVAKSAASGSRIVFDYVLKNALPSLRELQGRVAAIGEPFVFVYPVKTALHL